MEVTVMEQDNEQTIKTIADKWSVSRTTVYRYLEKINNNDIKNEN